MFFILFDFLLPGGPGTYLSFICLMVYDIIMNAKPNKVGLSESP